MRPDVTLLIGRTGQVGRALERELASRGTIVGTDRATLDLADHGRIRDVIRELRPALIVNAAAYTAVDQGESNEAVCMAINASAPAVMAEEARRAGIPLVHFSTDYVFDGAKRAPYVEADTPGPLNVYGRSKLEGERAILASGARAFIFRLGWVYDIAGRNFLTTIRRLAAERDVLTVIDDQRGVPTWSGSVAAAVARICARLRGYADGAWLDQRAGLYHMSGPGSATWAELAEQILRAAPVPGRDHVKVTPILTSQYPRLARRPTYSVMDSTRLLDTFGEALPPWDEQLRRCVASVAGSDFDGLA
jgi:dTDP-4-dehydrorhamnose reductase